MFARASALTLCAIGFYCWRLETGLTETYEIRDARGMFGLSQTSPLNSPLHSAHCWEERHSSWRLDKKYEKWPVFVSSPPLVLLEVKWGDMWAPHFYLYRPTCCWNIVSLITPCSSCQACSYSLITPVIISVDVFDLEVLIPLQPKVLFHNLWCQWCGQQWQSCYCTYSCLHLVRIFMVSGDISNIVAPWLFL